MGLPDDVLSIAIAGAVGPGAASEFMGFLRLYRALPPIDDILADPMGIPLPDEPNVLYAVATALASRATADNFDAVADYAERLLDEGHGEFAVLTIRDAHRRNDELSKTTRFGALVTDSEIGNLIGGAME